VFHLGRRRSVAFVPEHRVAAAGHGQRHEAEFDERLHSEFQHLVEDFRHIQEAELGTLRADGAADPHLVVEQAVTTHGLDSGQLPRANQVLLPLRAESNRGTVGAGAFLPVMRERLSLPAQVDLNAF